MQRINTENGLFKNINRITKEGGTIITADWLNAVQEELANLLAAFNIPLDESKNDQISDLFSNLPIIKDGTITWGHIIGSINLQSDLKALLDGKAALYHSHAATDIVQDSTHRFVTDTDINNWNSGTGGGGGASAAVDLTVDTSAFNNNLSALDDTAQKALDTIDDLVIPQIDTDITLSADSDSYVPSQKAVKAYVDNSISSALIYIGTTEPANPNPNTLWLDTSA